MSTTLVRIASLDDVDHIVKLILSLPSYPDTETDTLLISGEREIIQTVIKNRIKSAEIALFVAEQNKKITGVVYLNLDTGYIGQIHASFNDQETISALLDTVITFATQENLDALLIKISPKSHILQTVAGERNFTMLSSALEPSTNYWTRTTHHFMFTSPTVTPEFAPAMA